MIVYIRLMTCLLKSDWSWISDTNIKSKYLSSPTFHFCIFYSSLKLPQQFFSPFDYPLILYFVTLNVRWKDDYEFWEGMGEHGKGRDLFFNLLRREILSRTAIKIKIMIRSRHRCHYTTTLVHSTCVTLGTTEAFAFQLLITDTYKMQSNFCGTFASTRTGIRSLRMC